LKPIERMRHALSFKQQPQTVVNQLRSAEPKPPPEADGFAKARAATMAIPSAASEDISLRYMDEQLSACVIPESEATYETIRLDSVRIGSPTHVHVFEMYWADLSRPVGSFFRWLTEFYQLLFHLCSLGRKSLDFARAQYEPAARVQKRFLARLWPFFAGTQIFAEQLLALAIPILNLYLLGIASAVLPLLLPEGLLRQSVTAIIAVAVALLLGFVIFLKRQFVAPGGRPWPTLIAPLLLLGGAIAFVCFRFWIRPDNARIWAIGVWWVVPLIAITALG
jgi:hypothetical protein